jgi:hypothetical protein
MFHDIDTSTTYSAKLKQMMASWLGLMMMVDTQLKRRSLIH